MKRFAIASALFASAGLITSVSAAPILMTGWESDIIAEAAASDTASSTNGQYVRGIFVIAAQGYTGSGTPTGTPLPIGPGNIVTTKNGTDFFVDPTVNNTIRNEGDAGGTLSLITPGRYVDLQFFVTGVGGGDGSGNNALTATVNFSDNSSTVLQAGIGDWQGSRANNAFDDKTSHVDTRSDTYFGTGLWNREESFTLSLADQAKTIVSIDLALTDRIGVSGVSGTPVPEPASLALLGLGGMLIARRRRG